MYSDQYDGSIIVSQGPMFLYRHHLLHLLTRYARETQSRALFNLNDAGLSLANIIILTTLRVCNVDVTRNYDVRIKPFL